MSNTRYKDLTGKKFNFLTVIKFSHINNYKKSIWLCQCDCGKEKLVLSKCLINGETISCGCKRKCISPKNNLVGQKFGKLLVIEFLNFAQFNYKCRKSRNASYKCRCDCGKEYITYQHRLITNNTTSCGCYPVERCKNKEITNQKPVGQAAINNYYKCYKSSAKYRKIEFNLSKEDFTKLIFQNCYYCGIIPSKVHPASSTRNINGRILVNGIDRINSKLGYNHENCRSCCEQCNRAKLDYTEKEFDDWLYRRITHKSSIIDYYCI